MNCYKIATIFSILPPLALVTGRRVNRQELSREGMLVIWIISTIRTGPLRRLHAQLISLAWIDVIVVTI